MELLKFNSVSFCYPESTENVLHTINFSMEKSEFTVLCGQSGCGKTTLLRHIKKNQMPFGTKTGEVLFDGQDIEKMSDVLCASQIGFVGQNPDNQLVTDKVWHELAFGLENLGVPNGEIKSRVAEMAQYFGIHQWFHKEVNQLSGGQKQIVNLASVMVMKPKLLVLDEPTSQLDPIGARRFIQTLVQLNEDFGTAIILSEQRLEEVLPVADSVMIMQDGKLLTKTSPSQSIVFLQNYRKKTGEILPVWNSMPTASRTWLGVQDLLLRSGVTASEMPEEGQPPVTVRQGKKWLGSLAGQVKQTKENKKIILPGKPVLQAKSIEAGYKKGQPVLTNFSLTVNRGSIFAIMGGNGSGKTTALLTLADIIKPHRGRIKKQGKLVYLPQNPQSLFTEITVEDELAEVFENYGNRKGQGNKASANWETARKEIENMLAVMELTSVRKQNPFDLSGGQGQRLALAKLLLTNPDILLLDEPTKGLDGAFKAKLSRLMEQWKNAGKTVVMVSHDTQFCAENATHCGLLFDGELINSGDVREFFLNNTFYTTPACRMAAGILKDCVTCEDIIGSFGGGI